VEVQVGVLWAVQNGYLDDVPVDRVKEFQAKWTDFLTTRRPDVLKKIAEEKVLGAELLADLKATADQFKHVWAAAS
jgi:F-type H+-transporting ATPase subunit alpha